MRRHSTCPSKYAKLPPEPGIAQTDESSAASYKLKQLPPAFGRELILEKTRNDDHIYLRLAVAVRQQFVKTREIGRAAEACHGWVDIRADYSVNNQPV